MKTHGRPAANVVTFCTLHSAFCTLHSAFALPLACFRVGHLDRSAHARTFPPNGFFVTRGKTRKFRPVLLDNYL